MVDRDHVEIEIKLALLDADSWERARVALGEPTRIIEQTNHYYDTEDAALEAQRGMLRVREGAGAPVATLKLGARLQDGVLAAREVEAPLEAGDWEQVARGERGLESVEVSPVRVALAHLPPGAQLQLVGTMRNRRSVHELGGLLVELDRTELPDGTVDHEVELETAEPEAARARLVAVLDGCEARWAEQPATKVQRFLAALRRARAAGATPDPAP